VTTFNRGLGLLLCACVVAGAAAPAAAQFDLSVERALLLKLLRDGRYKQALAESRRIEESLVGRQAGGKPGRKVKDQATPASVPLVELLIYRGTVERRMGNLDAAEKTLTEAFSRVTNPDFRRMAMAWAPADGDARQQYVATLQLAYLQLLDNGTEVLIDRLRTFNYQRQAEIASGTAADVADERKIEIEELFRRIDFLVRLSIIERQTTAAVEGAGGDSPHARMMFTMARPYRLIGMRYLEASRLPWTIPFDADPATMALDNAASPPAEVAAGGGKTPAPARRPETAVERETQSVSQRLRAVGYLEKSRALGAKAIGAGAQESEAAAPPEPQATGEAADELSEADKGRIVRQEKNRVRGETSVPLAVLAMLDGDLERARTLINATLEGLRQAESPTHPELARPLILSAEIGLREGDALAEKKAFAAAEKKFSASADQLRQAKSMLESDDSEFDPASPLHRVLANLIAHADDYRAKSSRVASSASAADAAARRALAALARGEAAQKKPPKDAARPQPGTAVPPDARPAPPARVQP